MKCDIFRLSGHITHFKQTTLLVHEAKARLDLKVQTNSERDDKVGAGVTVSGFPPGCTSLSLPRFKSGSSSSAASEWNASFSQRLIWLPWAVRITCNLWKAECCFHSLIDVLFCGMYGLKHIFIHLIKGWTTGKGSGRFWQYFIWFHFYQPAAQNMVVSFSWTRTEDFFIIFMPLCMRSSPWFWSRTICVSLCSLIN